MTIEELQAMALEHGNWLDDNRLALSLNQLSAVAEAVRLRAFQELHELAMGPAEHAAIDALPTALVDSLAGRPSAMPLSTTELVDAMGMDEASPSTLERARRVERAVWLKHRLRLPDPGAAAGRSERDG